jgi:hypothetical protein
MTMWTNHAKDYFFAPKLSELTSHGAPALTLPIADTENWLLDFALETVVGRQIPDPDRQLYWTLIRRAQAAAAEYELGRQSLTEFFAPRPSLALRPYFGALRHFELCVALGYQGWMVVRQLTPNRPKLFEKGDGSEYDRMNHVYNAWRHADGFILQGECPPDSTLPVWITNDGLESARARISFAELRDMVQALARIVEMIIRPRPLGTSGSGAP